MTKNNKAKTNASQNIPMTLERFRAGFGVYTRLKPLERRPDRKTGGLSYAGVYGKSPILHLRDGVLKDFPPFPDQEKPKQTKKAKK